MEGLDCGLAWGGTMEGLDCGLAGGGAIWRGLAAVLQGLVQYGEVWLRSGRVWCNMDGSGCGLAGAGVIWRALAAVLKGQVQ